MKKKLRKKLKWCVFIGIVIIIYLFVCANRLIISRGEAVTQSQLNACTYEAVENVTGSVDFSQIFSVSKDNDGKIQLISVDGMKINLIAQSLAAEVASAYRQVASDGVDIPIGALSGISLLSGVGKDINFKLLTVESVKCELVSKFEQAGINQTRQSMYIKILPKCHLTVGLSKREVFTEVEFLCYENYIVGDVPEGYLDARTFSATVS